MNSESSSRTRRTRPCHASANAEVPDELLDERVQVGTFPWRFRGGESSVCRCVAFRET